MGETAQKNSRSRPHCVRPPATRVAGPPPPFPLPLSIHPLYDTHTTHAKIVSTSIHFTVSLPVMAPNRSKPTSRHHEQPEEGRLQSSAARLTLPPLQLDYLITGPSQTREGKFPLRAPMPYFLKILKVAAVSLSLLAGSLSEARDLARIPPRAPALNQLRSHPASANASSSPLAAVGAGACCYKDGSGNCAPGNVCCKHECHNTADPVSCGYYSAHCLDPNLGGVHHCYWFEGTNPYYCMVGPAPAPPPPPKPPPPPPPPPPPTPPPKPPPAPPPSP